MKDTVKIAVQIFLTIAVVLLGFYVGLWWCFIGGIVELINQFKTTETDSLVVAMSIARIVFFQIPIIFGIVVARLIIR